MTQRSDGRLVGFDGGQVARVEGVLPLADHRKDVHDLCRGAREQQVRLRRLCGFQAGRHGPGKCIGACTRRGSAAFVRILPDLMQACLLATSTARDTTPQDVAATHRDSAIGARHDQHDVSVHGGNSKHAAEI